MQQVDGALLFALAAVIGLTGAYLFSALTGDHCLNTQVQFDYPSTLLAIAALLLVAGITVVSTSHPNLGDTATALRVVLAFTAILVCVRIAFDYEYADQVIERYDHFIAQVEGLAAASPDPPITEGDAGLTATIDQQLGLYANHRWPGRDAEWPGLLAQDFFHTETKANMKVALGVTGLVAIAMALRVRWLMKPVVGHGFRTHMPRSIASSDRSYVMAVAAERAWRKWVSRLAVGGALAIVAMFSITTGVGGDRLMQPPIVQRVAMFGILASVCAFLIQPPLAGDQRSVPQAAAATWNGVLAAGRKALRLIPRRSRQVGQDPPKYARRRKGTRSPAHVLARGIGLLMVLVLVIFSSRRRR